VWQLTLSGLIGLSAATGSNYLSMPLAGTSPIGGVSSDGRVLFAGYFDRVVLGMEGAAP
jgi:hypothetical protein